MSALRTQRVMATGEEPTEPRAPSGGKGAGEREDRPATGRTLKTAVAVLQVLKFLEDRPAGATGDEVAGFLGKSTATAQYLLNSLYQEGYVRLDPSTGRHVATTSWSHPEPPDPAGDNPGSPGLDPAPDPSIPSIRIDQAPAFVGHDVDLDDDMPAHDRLREAVDELYGLTRHRAYLATRDRDGNAIVVQEMRGRQGLPTVPGLGSTIRGEAHALALGKALLAQRPGVGETYVEHYGLTRFTPRTITDPDRLYRELAGVRASGYAIDREEYAPGIWCLAVPLCAPDGRITATLGLSLTRGQMTERRRNLLGALGRVARTLMSEGGEQGALQPHDFSAQLMQFQGPGIEDRS